MHLVVCGFRKSIAYLVVFGIMLCCTGLGRSLVINRCAIRGRGSMFQTSRTLSRLYMGKKHSVRPSLDDIDRISRGQAAKKRGTGSRAVPHRLNEAERKEFELAKQRNFVSLRGTGWRAERGDSPLANIYRNYCDAKNIPCISVRRGVPVRVVSSSKSESDSDADSELEPSPETTENQLGDEVIVDFSPLRKKEVKEEAVQTTDMANEFSFVEILDRSDVADLGWDVQEIEEGFKEAAIWRIPVFSVSVTFLERAESKAFASTVAKAFTQR